MDSVSVHMLCEAYCFESYKKYGVLANVYPVAAEMMQETRGTYINSCVADEYSGLTQ